MLLRSQNVGTKYSELSVIGDVCMCFNVPYVFVLFEYFSFLAEVMVLWERF